MFYAGDKNSQRGITLDAKVLDRLAPDEINEIARWYEAEAKRLRLMASERELRQRRAIEAKKNALLWQHQQDKIGSILSVMIYEGLQPERAIKNLSKQLGEDEKKLSHIYRNYIKKLSREGRDARKIAAIRLAQAGWTNIEIAQELDCHPNTIGRDLKKAVATWQD